MTLFSPSISRLALTLSLCVLSTLTGAATLKESASGKPGDPPKEAPSTLIVSDTLHYDDTKSESTFTGNVVMTRGLLTLNSDVLQMHEDKDGFQFGTATVDKGKRVFIRQDRPDTFEVLEGIGDRAEYDGICADVETGKFAPKMANVDFSLDAFHADIDGANAKLTGALNGH